VGGPKGPGSKQPPKEHTPATGTTTHPPRKQQRKALDRPPTDIGQRPPVNQG